MGKRHCVAQTAIIIVFAASLMVLAACTGSSTASVSGGSTASATSSKSTNSGTADSSSASSQSTQASYQTAATGEYAAKLYDTSYVHTIDITISDEDWADLQANPLDKTKYKVDITIDGETVSEVSFATKGNTSLSSIAADPDSDRYSFKVNFGKYIDDQTYYGLDKLSLNNLYADATYMKDYLSYEIFRETGVESPLVSYVWLTINGEDHGLYIAIEELDSSYLDRTQDGEGELYKPETEMLGNMDKVGQGGQGGQMPDGGMKPPSDTGKMPGFSGQSPEGSMQSPFGNGQMPDFSGQSPDDNMQPPDGIEDFDMNGMFNFGGGFSMGGTSKGADLVYTDDELSSYSDILDNDETNASEEDNQRVVEALKALSEGNYDDALYTSEVIEYFAAHNFVLNYDSYTGTMLHNYYLYENDGKLSMLPWDYNLAFGGFGGGGGGFGANSSGATSLVNTGIDSPLSGTTESARPMWSWIMEDEAYTNQYHDVLDSLVANYFESGEFEEEIDALYEMLLPYVQKDPSAMYTSEEFAEGYETLKQFCILRAQSIRAQLDGKLATVTSDQKASDQIDASGISIDAMGSQGGSRGGEQNGGFAHGGFPGRR